MFQKIAETYELLTGYRVFRHSIGDGIIGCPDYQHVCKRGGESGRKAYHPGIGGGYACHGNRNRPDSRDGCAVTHKIRTNSGKYAGRHGKSLARS